jgi:hypothetical protein
MPITYNKIASVTVGSGGAASIDFTSIPATFTDLVLVYSARVTTAGGDDEALISLNSSTSNFSNRNIFGTGSTASSTTSPARFAGSVNASGSTASTFSNIQIYFSNYTGNTNKSYSIDSVAENNATAIVSRLAAGLWSDTSAITSISLSLASGSFVQYSTATLYGIKKD